VGEVRHLYSIYEENALKRVRSDKIFFDALGSQPQSQTEYDIFVYDLSTATLSHVTSSPNDELKIDAEEKSQLITSANQIKTNPGCP
jgi:hypothetical protein